MLSTSKKPGFIELFAGVGGFRIGLEKSGWEAFWSNQWEPSTKVQHASSCYVANFGSENHSNVDIKIAIDQHLNGEQLIPSADLIVGGFPCQDYSVAKSLNSSQGLEGKKGVLWWQIHRLVDSIRPRFVFLENVDRLLKSPSNLRGRDFAIMLRTLGDLGYQIEWRVVNAAEYGFPQRRIRIFIVAEKIANATSNESPQEILSKEGILARALPVKEIENIDHGLLDDELEVLSNSFNFLGKNSPFKSSGFYKNHEFWTGKAIPELSPKKVNLGDILVQSQSVPESFWIDENSLEKWKYLKGAKKIERVSASGHGYIYAEGSMGFPDDLEKPARTILTGEGGSTPSRFKHVIRVDGGHRRLTPIELERLNGFPDNWTLKNADGENISDAKRAFFMGNALVVGLIEKVGTELARRINLD